MSGFINISIRINKQEGIFTNIFEVRRNVANDMEVLIVEGI